MQILLHLMSTLKFHHDLLEKVLVITKNHCGSEPIILREPFSLLLAAIGGSIASADATVGNIVRTNPETIAPKLTQRTEESCRC